MADEEDLVQLHAGQMDLARSDFRGSDLSGLDLRNRDFTGSHLENASFADSDLSGAILSQVVTNGMQAPRAVLRQVRATATSYYMVNLQKADLRGAFFNNSHFGASDFREADLRGANFSNCQFNDGCLFDDAIIDENTLFDGARALRAMVRLPTFRYYRLIKGVLERVDPATEVADDIPRPVAQKQEPQPFVVREISQRRTEIVPLAVSVALLAEQRLEELSHKKPNDPDDLDAYEKEVSVLQTLSGGLRELAAAIPANDSMGAEAIEVKASAAAQLAETLSGQLVEVVKEHGKKFIATGLTVVCICGGAAILSMCGVPALGGAMATTALLEGKSALEVLKGYFKKEVSPAST
jgi:uncharacterized protein YjbI with pentapeptide repeats